MHPIRKAMIRKGAKCNAVWARPIQEVIIHYRNKPIGLEDTLCNVVSVISQSAGTVSILYRQKQKDEWRFITEIIPFDAIKYIEVVRDGTDPEEEELKDFEEYLAGLEGDVGEGDEG